MKIIDWIVRRRLKQLREDVFFQLMFLTSGEGIIDNAVELYGKEMRKLISIDMVDILLDESEER